MVAQREIYEADRAADSIHLRKVFRDSLRSAPLQEDLSDEERQLLTSALKFVSAVACTNLILNKFVKFVSRTQELASSSTSPEIQRVYQMHLDQLQTTSNDTESRAFDFILEDLTGKVVRISEAPVARGAFSAIWSGELYGKGVSVYSSTGKYEPAKTDLKSLEVNLII